MSGHTPGPWHQVGSRIFTGDDREVAVATKAAPGLRHAVYENARLIAAAPDLLEALTAAMAWIDAWCPDFIDDPQWPEDESKIRAAIAKAKGEA